MGSGEAPPHRGGLARSAWAWLTTDLTPDAGRWRLVTAFAAWPANWARTLLVSLAALCIYGVAIGLAPLPAEVAGAFSSNPDRGDQALYAAIVGRVGAGEGYHAAALAEQRARGYPVHPFIAVRPPLLASLEGRLGLPASAVLLTGLMVAAFVATLWRLGSAAPHASLSAPVLAAAVLAGSGMGLCALPSMVVWHEAWAALLIALSLFCRTERHWGVSVALGLAAALVRELALPYLAVMAALAIFEGRRREALAWMAAALVFGAALLWHAEAVAALTVDADRRSAGWVAVGGWGRPLAMIGAITLFGELPRWGTGLAVPLALLGWAAWPHAAGRRVALLLAGYAAAFSVLGRADNLYWGLMFAPLLPMGLSFAPAALRDLWQAARPRAPTAV